MSKLMLKFLCHNWVIGLLLVTINAQAQNKVTTPHKAAPSTGVMSQSERLAARKASKDTLNIPLYNGVYLGADLYGPGSKLFGSKSYNYEVSADVNLRNRFFPVIELGYGKTDYTKNSITYKSAAPYIRVGLNYKMKYRSKTENHLFLGFRYGFSHFKYSVTSNGITDGIWNTTVPLNASDINATGQWYELLAGIRVQLFHNLMAGWTLRYKTRISVTKNDAADAWYIPGFGENKQSNFGVTYSLFYKLPF
jgi:hypothetical protein